MRYVDLPKLLALFVAFCCADDEVGITLANFGSSAEFSQQERRHLLYDVNPGEGFNLRRDVYMRVANVVRQLRERGRNYVLVLPPWQYLYHWRRNREYRASWAEFFDLESMSRFVPVVEFDSLEKVSGNRIDLVLYLQAYAEGWSDQGFEERYDLRDCIGADRHYRKIGGTWQRFSGGFVADELKCLSFQGQSSTLANAIERNFSRPAESILHDHFGDVHYWQARMSMRYSKTLRDIGDLFRREKFNSTDESDHTAMAENWMEDRAGQKRQAKGGDYLCVHWRRGDFVNGHALHLPSILGTAKQLTRMLHSLKMHRLFLSTDADEDEIGELIDALHSGDGGTGLVVERFFNSSLSDGANAIVDQWICSHASHFVGTHLSTFSFRIHEDREILGFPPSTTFNRLCPDNNDDGCEQPAKWTITLQSLT